MNKDIGNMPYAVEGTGYSLLRKNKMKDQISIIWHIDDVLSVRPDLTDQKAREVLHTVKHNHDACYGINWDTLKGTADMMFPEGE